MSIELAKWTSDGDNVREVLSEVSDSLAAILNDQRQKLDQVDAKRPGPEWYELARPAGCFAAIAKGAKHRTLKPEQIFIPRSEFKVVNGQLRIPVLKATLSVPGRMDVKAITVPQGQQRFSTSVLEVIEQKEV
jgi:hypothetical protein